ncbi:enoyl-CoA hydratase-related protein [Sneathiella marina]|uniref:Enoyl-CoA hydratase-related protein n=1 Tax=Sneathiella marina TaxID=2950108 RepID=A0ABY4W5A6_9PROT|nr:enoyl-CoA hydratase-related protein [Sneathiella marina]USG60895.1 enoyl-CoA hydratase-related protein [Sneathiella marina]
MTMPAQTVDTGTDQLLCEIADRVATITLNRPDARNALSDDLTPALRRMIKECGSSDDVGALLITGTGTAFCAGGDVKGMGGRSSKPEMTQDEKVNQLKVRQRTLTGALKAVRKPTIAALPGPAAGAGLSIALACDIRFASQSAFISTGYARVGLSGDYGIAWLLTQVVGTAKARELLFSAAKVGSEECLRLGLVNQLFPDDILMSESRAFCKSLANGPAITLQNMKDNLDDALDLDFLTCLDSEAERLVKTAQTEDHKEAVRAFIEKRTPNFKGR